MAQLKTNNFLTTTRPMFFLSKFCGLHLFKIWEKNHKIISSVIYPNENILLFIILLSFNIYAFIWHWKSSSHTNISRSFIIDHGLRISIYIGTINDVFVLIWNSFYAAKSLRIFKTFLHFDDKVRIYLFQFHV